MTLSSEGEHFLGLYLFVTQAMRYEGLCVCVCACVCVCVCVRHLHPEVLAAGSEIRPHVFSCCQLNGRMSELGWGGVLTRVRLHARECFLTQIPAGWESNVRKEKGETMK